MHHMVNWKYGFITLFLMGTSFSSTLAAAALNQQQQAKVAAMHSNAFDNQVKEFEKISDKLAAWMLNPKNEFQKLPPSYREFVICQQETVKFCQQVNERQRYLYPNLKGKFQNSAASFNAIYTKNQIWQGQVADLWKAQNNYLPSQNDTLESLLKLENLLKKYRDDTVALIIDWSKKIAQWPTFSDTKKKVYYAELKGFLDDNKVNPLFKALFLEGLLNAHGDNEDAIKTSVATLVNGKITWENLIGKKVLSFIQKQVFQTLLLKPIAEKSRENMKQIQKFKEETTPYWIGVKPEEYGSGRLVTSSFQIFTNIHASCQIIRSLYAFKDDEDTTAKGCVLTGDFLWSIITALDLSKKEYKKLLKTLKKTEWEMVSFLNSRFNLYEWSLVEIEKTVEKASGKKHLKVINEKVIGKSLDFGTMGEDVKEALNFLIGVITNASNEQKKWTSFKWLPSTYGGEVPSLEKDNIYIGWLKAIPLSQYVITSYSYAQPLYKDSGKSWRQAKYFFLLQVDWLERWGLTPEKAYNTIKERIITDTTYPDVTQRYIVRSFFYTYNYHYQHLETAGLIDGLFGFAILIIAAYGGYQYKMLGRSQKRLTPQWQKDIRKAKKKREEKKKAEEEKKKKKDKKGS